MRVTVYGAAGVVTGSAYHVRSDRADLLVDLGLFQGDDDEAYPNRLPEGLEVGRLDTVLLTHAHLDHVGRLPLLEQAGYRGPIYATPATIELTEVILEDSARIQEHDSERANRRRARAGQPPLVPLYGEAEVAATLARCRPVAYEEPLVVAPGVTARFVEAGHMLGSTSIELTVEEGGRRRVIVFSGDIGPRGAPILRDARPFTAADAVVLESTYGDRDHQPIAATIDEFRRIMRAAVGRRGKVLVPSFAVGRTQVVVYLLAMMFRAGELAPIPVYVDSPMAVAASNIYLKHPELVDEEVRAAAQVRPLAEDLATVRLVSSAAESRALNEIDGPCVIIAASGMCEAGRILHHLRHNLWKPETAVVITGYQSARSLGRRLVEGAERVRVFGDEVEVRASVHTLNGLSAHAGQGELLRWCAGLADDRPALLLTHGEDGPRAALAARLEERYGLHAELPAYGGTLEL